MNQDLYPRFQLLTYNHRLHNVGVDIMKLRGKLASFAKNTRLGTFNVVCLASRRRAAMAIDALDILTTTTIDAGSHPSNKTERSLLVSSKLVAMKMRTLFIIRAFVAEEMDVAEFHPLNTIDFGFVVVLAGRVDALSRTIAGNDFIVV